MDNLKLVKKAYNNHDKKGITLINIVVLLFCILIVYGFNISNIVSKDRLNIRVVKNNINTTEQQNINNTNANNNNNSNNNTNSNNTNTDNLISKRQILEEKIKKEITEKVNISQDLNTTFNEVVSLQNKIAENDLEIAKLDGELKELENKIIPLKKEELRLKDAKNKQEKIAKTRLKYMYMNGKFKTLEILLGSKNLLEMFSNYYMLQEINGMDVRLLENLDKDRKRLEVITKDLREYEIVIKTKKDKQQHFRKLQENFVILKNAKINELTENQKEIAKELETLEKEKIETEKQIAEKTRYIQRIPKYVGGTLMWPVPSSNSTRWITAFFGAGASQGYPGSNHSGVDIAIPRGEVRKT